MRVCAERVLLRQRRHQQPQPSRRYLPAVPVSRRREAVMQASGLAAPLWVVSPSVDLVATEGAR